MSASRCFLLGTVVMVVWCEPSAALRPPRWEESVCLLTILSL